MLDQLNNLLRQVEARRLELVGSEEDTTSRARADENKELLIASQCEKLELLFE